MGPKNAILGEDAGYGLDLPDTAGNVSMDAATANMARFSKTKEFKALKEKLESRIEYYRTYQPGGNGTDFALKDLSNEERGWRTLAADLLISEFRAVIMAYELAAEEVKNEASRSKNT